MTRTHLRTDHAESGIADRPAINGSKPNQGHDSPGIQLYRAADVAVARRLAAT